MTRRQLVLVATLVATLAATWWASTMEDVPTETAAVPTARAPRMAGRAGVQDGRPLVREAVPHIARSAWPPSAARLMEPPGVVAEGAGAVPQQATEPPPLPFVFVGAIEDGGQRTAILIEGEQVHLVVARQRIDARYRVDRVLATRIEFTYLPMERKQVLDLAGDPDHGG